MPAYTSLRKHKKCVIKFSFVVLLLLSSLIYYHPGVPCRLCTVDAHLLLSPQLRGEWQLPKTFPIALPSGQEVFICKQGCTIPCFCFKL